ncbi:MAG: S8 family serine peptidase [Defluviitaleaceae bacterium]|nr:S8 family serine peptidase [Defluviitaleaceae bacterium]
MHQPISIAILDTGVAPVPDLQGRILDSVDFINGQNHPYDDNGHGTHVEAS